MNQKYLDKLEYSEIIKQIANYCVTEMGKEKALCLHPYDTQEMVKQQLAETDEAIIMLIRNTKPPLGQIEKNEKEIKILENEGVLAIPSLLKINKVFIIAEQMKDYLGGKQSQETPCGRLRQKGEELYKNVSISKKIQASILDETTIAEGASSNLKTIRRKQRKREQEIKDTLNHIIHSSSISKYIQESIVTIRNDRYVIPVKEEYRSQVKGFVHDISSTGSTVFIEPTSVFEANNELNHLKMEENLEIEKILRELSQLLYPYTEELRNDIEILGMLDFVFAKAKYANEIKGIIPVINQQKQIYLKQARHPLLDSKKVVPITLELGNQIQTLVITGPNTGGKTVALKTVGLLTCMACSGLAIPAQEDSTICVCDQIFADIGDNQSISDSLSTFSAHMVNLVEILTKATDQSLVLVDELGSGTDPVEGAALAISILEELQKIGALTISTTHYQELKKYALVTPHFENASVEFDIHTLTPTYQLLIGVPGKSNAFAISQKLGLKDPIIQNAKNRLLEKDIHFEEVLKQIYDDKIQMEQDKKKIETELKKVEQLHNQLENELVQQKNQEQERVQKAKREAREILLEAKQQANQIIKQLQEIDEPNSKIANQLRNELNEQLKKVSGVAKQTNRQNVIGLQKQDIKPNQTVFVTTLHKQATILSYPSKTNEVQVQVENLKMNVPITDLTPVSKQELEKKEKSIAKGYTSIAKTRTATTEIKVIGYTVEEANLVIDKFLDDASLAKIQTVRIVHGKGTGKLRQGIHQFLKNHTHVKSYRLGTFGEGEMGVTVVEIK